MLRTQYANFHSKSALPLTIVDGSVSTSSEGVLLDVTPDEIETSRPTGDLSQFIPDVTQKARIAFDKWPKAWKSLNDKQLAEIVKTQEIHVAGFEYIIRGSSVRYMLKQRSALDIMLSEGLFSQEEEDARFGFVDWVRLRDVLIGKSENGRVPQYQTTVATVRLAVDKKSGDEDADFVATAAEAFARLGTLKEGDVIQRGDDVYAVGFVEPEGRYERAAVGLRAY